MVEYLRCGRSLTGWRYPDTAVGVQFSKPATTSRQPVRAHNWAGIHSAPETVCCEGLKILSHIVCDSDRIEGETDPPSSQAPPIAWSIDQRDCEVHSSVGQTIQLPYRTLQDLEKIMVGSDVLKRRFLRSVTKLHPTHDIFESPNQRRTLGLFAVVQTNRLSAQPEVHTRCS